MDRETKYYLENITKVKSIDEFVNNDRLFRYAMKAHGLEDMTYAKAFVIKALKEGVSDPDSFANKLTDKRYAEFVTSYNFEKYGELATSFNKAQHDVPKNFATRVELAALQNGFDQYGAETGYYLTNISKVTSVDELMADNRLLTYAMAAFGLNFRDGNAGKGARDAGRRRERSRQSCKRAGRQALRELRLGVQLRRERRADDVARCRPDRGSQDSMPPEPSWFLSGRALPTSRLRPTTSRPTSRM